MIFVNFHNRHVQYGIHSVPVKGAGIQGCSQTYNIMCRVETHYTSGCVPNTAKQHSQYTKYILTEPNLVLKVAFLLLNIGDPLLVLEDLKIMFSW